MNPESDLNSVPPPERRMVHEEAPAPNLSGLFRESADMVEADSQAALNALTAETSISNDTPPAVRSESTRLVAERQEQIGKSAAEARVKLTFMKESGWLQAVPEPGEIETRLAGRPESSGDIDDKAWAEEALAAAKRGEPISVDETPATPDGTAKQEQTAEKFDALKQYEGLRPRLQAVLKDFAPIARLFDAYAPKTLRQALVEMVGSSTNYRAFANVVLDLRKGEFKGESNGKSTDQAAALKELQATTRVFFDNLPSNFSIADCFGTSDPALIRSRRAEMSAKRSAMGRTSPSDSMLMDILMEVGKSGNAAKTTRAEAPKKAAEFPPEQPPAVVAAEKKLGQITVPETAGSGEDWLDMDREAAFAKVSDYFQKLKSESGEQGVREWFVTLFNAATKSEEPLTVADVRSLVSADVVSPSASRVAGREIRRPVLLFGDRGQFIKFANSLGVAHAGERTLGMKIPGNASAPESLLSKTGLIISMADKNFVGHEVRHSIDPHELKRRGADRAIDEAFAHYHDEIENKLSATNEASDSVWEEFFETLTDDTYEQQYAFDLPNATIPGGWKTEVRQLVAAIKDITKEGGALYAQRALVKSETITDVLQIAKMK